MYLRLAFSVAVHTDPEIFLVDEILAVGDEPFQRKCLDKIKQLSDAGKTLIVVSHDLDLVSRICDRGVVLDHGNVVFDGPIAEAVSTLRSANQR
jgi:ABC-2 type transport system ATP-binding protein